jgi:hypothetical protein
MRWTDLGRSTLLETHGGLEALGHIEGRQQQACVTAYRVLVPD